MVWVAFRTLIVAGSWWDITGVFFLLVFALLVLDDSPLFLFLFLFALYAFSFLDIGLVWTRLLVYWDCHFYSLCVVLGIFLAFCPPGLPATLPFGSKAGFKCLVSVIQFRHTHTHTHILAMAPPPPSGPPAPGAVADFDDL